MVIAGDGPQRVWVRELASHLGPGRIELNRIFLTAMSSPRSWPTPICSLKQ